MVVAAYFIFGVGCQTQGNKPRQVRMPKQDDDNCFIGAWNSFDNQNSTFYQMELQKQARGYIVRQVGTKSDLLPIINWSVQKNKLFFHVASSLNGWAPNSMSGVGDCDQLNVSLVGFGWEKEIVFHKHASR